MFFESLKKVLKKLAKSNNSSSKDKAKHLKDIKVAFIADEFTYSSYKHEFNAIKITPDNWKDTFIKEKPDLFFCESTWKGYSDEKSEGPWSGKVFKDNRLDYENRTELLEILDYCKKNSITTIFWNKEDPVYYNHRFLSFAKTASEFDYIFTSSKETVPQYKKDFNHPHVHALSFAAQPKLFNPLKETSEEKNAVVFAGSYCDGHVKRVRLMDDIFDRILDKDIDLVIYDRNYYFEHCNFPERYLKYTNPPIDYDETPKLYKEYNWCLNLNTVTDSETMFARRVYELAASYTNILTNYSVGVDKIFKDNVFFFDKTDEMPDFNETYDEKRLNNLYNVLENHTYKKRWMEILDVIGFDYIDDLNDVSVIYKLNNSGDIEKFVENFNNIDYPQKTLKVLLNSPDIDIDQNKYGEIDGIYDNPDELKNEISSEYWIIADDLIDSKFIKKAILHHQYLNKRIPISNNGKEFEMTTASNIENILFNKINLDYLTNNSKINVYPIK